MDGCQNRRGPEGQTYGVAKARGVYANWGQGHSGSVRWMSETERVRGACRVVNMHGRYGIWHRDSDTLGQPDGCQKGSSAFRVMNRTYQEPLPQHRVECPAMLAKKAAAKWPVGVQSIEERTPQESSGDVRGTCG